MQLGRTALTFAAAGGHANVVATLLRAGADYEPMDAASKVQMLAL